MLRSVRRSPGPASTCGSRSRSGVALRRPERIAAAVVEGGGASRVGYNYRHLPAVVKARALIASGGIGRVTHARFRMLTDYAAHPRGSLTWRFEAERGGDGVIGDLLSHGANLVRHLLGEVDRLVADTAVLIPERPLPTGAGSHYDVSEGGQLGRVENPDYAACLLRTVTEVPVFLEASRVAVGDQNNYGFEVRGTQGLLMWDFRRPGELQVSSGDGYANQPVTTLLAGPGDGDYARFQPGAGITMSFDDTKVIECAGLLAAVVARPRLTRGPRSTTGWQRRASWQRSGTPASRSGTGCEGVTRIGLRRQAEAGCNGLLDPRAQEDFTTRTGTLASRSTV